MKRIVREVGLKTYVQSRLGIYEFDEKPKIMLSGNEIIEQITFEQAFAEWDSKPIAFIFNNDVYWISLKYEGISGNSFSASCVSNLIKEIDVEDIIDNKEVCFYQSDSPIDVHLNVIPTLIRMARGGVCK